MADVTGEIDTRLEPGPLRPTRRMLVVPTLGLVLWGAGANAGAGFLVILAGGLVASVPWAWATARRTSRTVHVRRVVPTRVDAGEAIHAALHVRAVGLCSLVVHDELLSAVGVLEDTQHGGCLVATPRLARGCATSGLVEAEVTDPFGLFRAVASAQVPSVIEVWPALVVREPTRLGSASRQEADDRPRRRGSGSETDGTREYRHGDSPRAVHWRSSARHQTLVVRQFVGDTSGRLRVTVEPGPWTAGALDRACLIAASVAESAHRGGAEVQLGVGGGVLPWFPSGRRALATLTPNLGHATGRGAPVPAIATSTGRDHHDTEVTLRMHADRLEAVLPGTDGAGHVVDLPDELEPAEAVLRVMERLRQGAWR